MDIIHKNKALQQFLQREEILRPKLLRTDDLDLCGQ